MTTAAEDAIAVVTDLLSLDAELWKPEPGDQVAGTLRAIGRRTTQHSTDYPVLTIQQADGACFEVHAFHTVLWEEVRLQQPRIGDVVGAAQITNNIGELKSDQGYLSTATELFEEARGVFELSGHRMLETLATSNLGRAAARAGPDAAPHRGEPGLGRLAPHVFRSGGLLMMRANSRSRFGAFVVVLAMCHHED
jgi:hypothetical protein